MKHRVRISSCTIRKSSLVRRKMIKIRILRLEVAKEETVSPYIVFFYKTLVHISVRKPKTKEEVLSVSGEGEFKFEKYGKSFLEVFL